MRFLPNFAINFLLWSSSSSSSILQLLFSNLEIVEKYFDWTSQEEGNVSHKKLKIDNRELKLLSWCLAILESTGLCVHFAEDKQKQ